MPLRCCADINAVLLMSVTLNTIVSISAWIKCSRFICKCHGRVFYRVKSMYSWIFFFISASFQWIREQAEKLFVSFMRNFILLPISSQTNYFRINELNVFFFSLSCSSCIYSEAGYAFNKASTMKRRIEKLLSLRQSASYLLCFFSVLLFLLFQINVYSKAKLK